MPRIVAFLNRKGGVGKTSTVHHLAGTLARRGLRVLVVDADPQASLTQGLLGPDVAEDLDPRETIAALFDESGMIEPRSLVRPTAFPGVSYLQGRRPPNVSMSLIPSLRPGIDSLRSWDRLRRSSIRS